MERLTTHFPLLLIHDELLDFPKMYFQISCSILFAVYLVCQPLRAQDPLCCSHAPEYSSCKEACDQLATIKSESRLKHLLQRLPSYCPESMNELWTCVNSTLPGVSRKSEGWVGLGCCELAISAECRRKCEQASSKNDITKVCKKVTEKPLYGCITKNEIGSTCCSYAGRHTICREYCQAIFRTDSTLTASQISAVKDYCQSHSSQLLNCVNNFTKSYPIRSPLDSLYCCDRAEQSHCQVACRRILRTMNTEHEIMEGLIEECGSQPLPQDPLWQCFLGSAHPPSPPEEETPHPAKMDQAKLHCCSKANTSLCREMCEEMSTNWGSQTWQDFDQLCEYNPVETELISCLSDVREPCQLGCKDLHYCTNFNNRPTELFRSCNVQSDQGAMNDFKLWSNGTIKMPYMNIPVLDIRKCLPDTWKAVACVLQIKPCHSKSRGSLICKSDCVEILTQCGDRRRFHEGQTPERICELLSPVDDPERCIPLHTYLTPSIHPTSVVEEVIHPCNPSPCPSNHLCQVNRRGCLDEYNCLPYICVPACKLGEASEFLVQQDSLIQVPSRSAPAGCYEVCSCGASGRLENCVEMPCVDTTKACVVGGQKKSHGSSFQIDCHHCSCFSGDTVCSTRECLSEASSETDWHHFTGLPCSCPDHFIPVCASNGRTYPSACVARCMGFKDHQFVFGQCRLTNPCASKPCLRSQRCVSHFRVCLSDSGACPQFECVGRASPCDRSTVEPVCDTEGLVHPSLCHLQQAGKSLAYMGQCQESCQGSQFVCGHNGETYKTVCDAFSDRVAVDYPGPCQAVGPLSDSAPDSSCALIQCPPVSTPGCQAVIPPGACCPICASMLQILWNKEHINTFSKLKREEPVTVQEVLRVLRLHVSVPQCDVFGYLSIDHVLVVLIAPVEQQPTPLQVEACGKEAEKIDSLINYSSPTLMSHVPLSAFLSSQLQTSSIVSSSGTPAHPLSPSLALLLGLLLTAAPSLCAL